MDSKFQLMLFPACKNKNFVFFKFILIDFDPRLKKDLIDQVILPERSFLKLVLLFSFVSFRLG